MSDINPNNIDVNVVVQKLQARLGEAMTVIAVLESQLEAAQQRADDSETTVLDDE